MVSGFIVHDTIGISLKVYIIAPWSDGLMDHNLIETGVSTANAQEVASPEPGSHDLGRFRV